MTGSAQRAARHALVEMLRDAQIERLGDRITTNRARAIWADSLAEGNAAAVVYFTTGEAQLESENHPRVYEESAELHVEILVQTGEDADDIADDVAHAVRQAVFASAWLRDTARDARYLGFRSGLVDEAQRLLASHVVRFQVKLQLLAPEETPMDDLELVHTTELLGPEGSPVTEQEIEIEVGP